MPTPSDMGGRTEYYGPIVREPGEPVFHANWERRVFGMAQPVMALLDRNVDAFRFAMERLPREVYLSSYYRRWLGGFEDLLVRAGYLGPDEVDARIQGRAAQPGSRRFSRMRLAVTSSVIRAFQRPTLPRWLCAHVLPRLFGTSRPALRPRRFSVGDRIRVRSEQAPGHTRQPGYTSGKAGVVTAHHGATVFPDAHAVGRRALPQHLYTVTFEGSELWGDNAEANTEVRIDLFEAYLEPV